MIYLILTNWELTTFHWCLDLMFSNVNWHFYIWMVKIIQKLFEKRKTIWQPNVEVTVAIEKHWRPTCWELLPLVWGRVRAKVPLVSTGRRYVTPCSSELSRPNTWPPAVVPTCCANLAVVNWWPACSVPVVNVVPVTNGLVKFILGAEFSKLGNKRSATDSCNWAEDRLLVVSKWNNDYTCVNL